MNCRSMAGIGDALPESRVSKHPAGIESPRHLIEHYGFTRGKRGALKGEQDEDEVAISIISECFGNRGRQSLVKRHRMVYDALADELQSGLHAISIVAKTPQETGAK
ncbi:SufE-like protein 1, chloroplastic/mitochondrial, partial [Cucurbita argyrosperma subsp. sororia]